MQTRLMIVVERAVRPVRAPVSTKMRMREELLSHLMDIHAEEAASGGDEASILRRTLARFGTPDALTEELQHSLNWQERYEAWLNHWLERRAGERPVQVAGRVALIMFLMLNGLFVCIAATRWLIGSPSPAGGPLWTVPLGLTTMLALDAFVLGWLGVATADRIRPPAKAAWRQPRVWGAALLGGAFVDLAGISLVQIVSREWFPRSETSQWSVLALAAVLGFISVLQLFQQESAKVAEWNRLDLTLDPAPHP